MSLQEPAQVDEASCHAPVVDTPSAANALWPEMERAFASFHRGRRFRRAAGRTALAVTGVCCLLLGLALPKLLHRDRQQAHRVEPTHSTKVPTSVVPAPVLSHTQAAASPPSAEKEPAPVRVEILSDEQLIAFLESSGKPWIPVEINGQLRVYLSDNPDPKARLN